MAEHRPDPVQWLWYAFGGRLPEAYRAWVLHDVTARNWRARYTLQITVRTMPFLVAGFVLIAVLPEVTAQLAVGAMLVALLLTLFFTIGSAVEFREVRLRQHGFPPGTARQRERERRYSTNAR